MNRIIPAALACLALSGCATIMSAEQKASVLYCKQPYEVRKAWLDSWNAGHPEVQLRPSPCLGDPG